jgi:hypothetical protein
MEYEDEEYIDIKDLEVIEDSFDDNYEPSDEGIDNLNVDLIEYAQFLGFDLENYNELSLQIAYQALKTPLPENWKRACIKNSDEILFINIDDNTIHGISPIDEAATVHYEEQKENLEKVKKAGPKVIPKAKNLPPIKKGEEGVTPSKPNQLPTMDKKANDKLSKSPIQEKSNTPVNDLSRDEVPKPKETKPKKPKKEPQDIPVSKPKDPMSNLMPGAMGKSNDIYNIPINMNFGEVQEFKAPVKEDIHPVIKPTDIANLNTTKKSAQKFNTKEYDISVEQESITKEIVKDYKLKVDKNKEKKEYYKLKLNELKDFKNKLKEEVNKEKIEYKNRKDQLKAKLTNEYEEKLKNEKKKYSDIDSDPEIAGFKQILEKETEDKLRNLKINTIEDNIYEARLETLMNEKQKLLDDLNRVKNLKDQPILENNLKGVRELLAEKFEIDKQNSKRKYEILEHEMNTQEEENHNSEIENIKNQFEANQEVQDKQINNSFQKILEDFQKTLENDFNNQSKTIMNELQNVSNDEYRDFRKRLNQEKDEKRLLYKKELDMIEKAYIQGKFINTRFILNKGRDKEAFVKL